MQFWLKTSKLLTVAFSVVALAFVGCGDDDDDDDNGAGPTGAGTEITEANAAVVQGAVTTTIGSVIGKGAGTHNGAVSGKVKITQSVGKVAQLPSVKYKLDFDNYSDDGEIWLDGTVDYSLDGVNFSYKVDIEISGAYSGKVEGEISLANGAYSGYWNVNGTRINF